MRAGRCEQNHDHCYKPDSGHAFWNAAERQAVMRKCGLRSPVQMGLRWGTKASTPLRKPRAPCST